MYILFCVQRNDGDYDDDDNNDNINVHSWLTVIGWVEVLYK